MYAKQAVIKVKLLGTQRRDAERWGKANANQANVPDCYTESLLPNTCQGPQQYLYLGRNGSKKYTFKFSNSEQRHIFKLISSGNMLLRTVCLQIYTLYIYPLSFRLKIYVSYNWQCRCHTAVTRPPQYHLPIYLPTSRANACTTDCKNANYNSNRTFIALILRMQQTLMLMIKKTVQGQDRGQHHGTTFRMWNYGLYALKRDLRLT